MSADFDPFSVYLDIGDHRDEMIDIIADRIIFASSLDAHTTALGILTDLEARGYVVMLKRAGGK